MFCSHCGKEIPDVDICPLCGCYSRNSTVVQQTPEPAPDKATRTVPKRMPSKKPVTVMAVIVFCITLIAESCFLIYANGMRSGISTPNLITSVVYVLCPFLFLIFCPVLDKKPVLAAVPVALLLTADVVFMIMNAFSGHGSPTMITVIIYLLRFAFVFVFAHSLMKSPKRRVVDFVFVIIFGVLIEVLALILNVRQFWSVSGMGPIFIVYWFCDKSVGIIDLITKIMCVSYVQRKGYN